MELARGEAYDQGLRNYMTSIYNWMGLGLLISAVTAWATINSSLLDVMKSGGILFWVALLAPFGLIFAMAGGMRHKSLNYMRTIYGIFCVCEGLTLAVIVSQYTSGSVVSAFLATAAAFSSLSLWGYTTKRNLSGMGSFLMMGLIGLIVAMLLNIFFQSSMMDLVISCAGVLIFAGLVAYDTQTLKNQYVSGDEEFMAKLGLWGALSLYLDFLNLFLFLLRFLGVKSDD